MLSWTAVKFILPALACAVLAAGVASHVADAKAEKREKALLKQTQRLRNELAAADSDRVVFQDSISRVVERLVEERQRADEIDGVLAETARRANATLLSLQQVSVGLRNLMVAQTEGRVLTDTPQLTEAEFYHRSNVLDADTRLTLTRASPGAPAVAREDLNVLRIDVPADLAFELRQDGAIAALATCAAGIPNCTVTNRSAPVIPLDTWARWAEERGVARRPKGPDPLLVGTAAGASAGAAVGGVVGAAAGAGIGAAVGGASHLLDKLF